jgi:hypothetical protein
MPVFTLLEFEQVGSSASDQLRLLGQREIPNSTVSEGKQWLSTAILEGRLQTGRFYHWFSTESTAELRPGSTAQVSFCLFEDARLCPLRIWHRPEWRGTAKGEWVLDCEGIPGWSAIASLEPRWRLERTVPAERSWMGRSRRDWQRRDCWRVSRPANFSSEQAA